MIKRFTLFLFFLISFNSFSQKMLIKGNVFDSTGAEAIENAIVMAVRLKDSVLIDYTHTNSNGEFQLNNVDLDTFTLIISHYKYDDRSYFIFGSAENNEIIIPVIRLFRRPKEIQEVVVYANKNPIYFRGDTLVYVADSFQVKENAVVEDLLKKLPGITVDENGKIKAQGKEISKVFVDGDEFFGTDPTIATKNLGAKGVETVEVYEKKNEDAADGEEETIQVLNLTLKEEAKRGYFGRISAGTDFSQFYESELLFNKFNNTQKISVFLLGSNTPRSNFNWDDINQFGLDNENGWKEDEDGNWSQNGMRTDGNGIPQTLRSGIYFSDRIGKKENTKIGFDYTYVNYSLNAISESYSQYFLSDSTYFSADSTRSISKNEMHTINFTLTSDLDSLTSIEFKPSFKSSASNTITKDYSHYFTSENLASRSTLISKNNESLNNNFESEINFKRAFKKDRRELKLKHSMRYDDNNSEGELDFEDHYYLGTSPNDSTNQKKFGKNLNNIQSGKLTYTEPITKKIKAEFEYFLESTKSDQSKETRNIIDGNVAEIDSNFTNIFENSRLKNRIGLQLIYESRKHSISGGLKYQNIQIENNNVFTNMVISQNVTNYLPRLSYTFKPNQTSRLQIRYITSSSVPSVNALQPVPDNSNPNKVVIGNPDLLPNFTQNGRLSYNSWNALKNRSIWLGANINNTRNAFIDSTTYDSDGRQSVKTINSNGNVWANIYGGGGIGLYKKVIELGPGFSSSYSQNYSYINGERNERTSFNLAADLSLRLNLDSLSFSIRSEFSYMNSKSSINLNTNKPFSRQEYSANINWNLPWWHISISSDVSYTINSQRSDGYNINYLIWNASIDKAFLKKENLVLSFQGNDMLNQNIVAQRNVNANTITDFKTKIISRYFLLKITYKFNNKPPKTDENEEN